MKINEIFDIYEKKIITTESASVGAVSASNVASVSTAMNGVRKRSAPTSLFASSGIPMDEKDLASLCHMTPYRKKSK